MYEIDKLETIFIGYQGENETRTIAIDVSSWIKEFPQGNIAILHSRPTEQNPYIVSNTTVNNGILEWVVNNADVGISGMGYAVAQMSYNEQVLKTAVFTTKIGKTLDGTISPTPIPPAPSWVTDILNSRSEQFEINEGHLIVTKIDGTTEDLGQVVGAGGVTSVNNKTGDVVLDAIDVSAIPQVTGEFLYNGGSKIEDPKWQDKIVQCIEDFVLREGGANYKAGYFYYIAYDGDLREQINVQPQPVIPTIEHVQKTGTELNDAQGLEEGNIYQCTSDRSADYATISNDTQFHQGYFYLYNGEQAQYTYTRKDTQPASGGGAVDSVNGQTGAVVLTASDVGALPDNTPIPTKTSDLQNDSGFITKAVNDLTNYYLKAETYTKAEVNTLIGAITAVSFEVVVSLPTQDIHTNVIYLVPKSTSQTQNIYDEYIYINNAWEKIGDTQIDLSGYATKVSGATANNFAGLDSAGNLIDSGKNASDFATPNDLSSKQDVIDDDNKLPYAYISGTPTIPTKTSDLTNDSGFMSDTDALAVGSVEVDVNSVKAYDYEQTYTIPNDIASGATIQIEFADSLREFALEITTPEATISAGTGYFYLATLITSGTMNNAGRFLEAALGQSHASKICVSFAKGRDGIFRLYGYKFDTTSSSDYSSMPMYTSFPRQNIGRQYLANPQPILGIWFTSGIDMTELAGTTIKVRGLKW